MESSTDRLIDFVTELGKRVESNASEQLPLVAKEIVAWQTSWSLFGVIVGGVLLVSGASVFVAMFRSFGRKPCSVNEELRPAMTIGSVVALGIGLIVFGIAARDLIKCYTAPRLVVVDYIKALTK